MFKQIILKLKSRLPFITIVLFVIGVLVIAEVKRYKLKYSGKYTIGYTVSTYQTMANGTMVQYYYKIKGQLYKESDHFKSQTRIPARYLVVFYRYSPDLSRLLQEEPIPPQVKFAPKDGWEKIPDWAKK